MSSPALHAPAPVVTVSSSGPSSGAAERCLMHLHRMQSGPKDSALALQNHIIVEHNDAHAIIVLHVDSSSCTPLVGGGIALDSLHCTAQYMLLSLLYRSTMHEAQCGVSFFSLVVVGLQPRLLIDCTDVTRSNVTKALTSLTAFMLELPVHFGSQQTQSTRPINDLDFIMAACLSIAQSKPYKPGVIMISECNISSSSSQPMSASAIALAAADCSFSVIKPVSNARVFPLGCIPDPELMSFIARRSNGVMWVANLAVLGAVLITPDLFDSLDQLASRSHSLPEIQIILDAVSQRSSVFPQGRISELQHARPPPLSLQTSNPSLGGPGGVVASHTHQPRLLHKDAHSSNMHLWISSKARLGFVPRVLRRVVVGGSSVIIGAQMALAISPGVEIVASAVVASETDLNSLIVQIHCDGLRFTDASKLQQHPHQHQNHHTPPHQQSQHNPAGIRSAGLNGPLHNEALQLAELLVFLDRQLSRFARIPYEPNPTISESTHDTIIFLLSMPSPHLLPSMHTHHEYLLLPSHVAAKIKDGSLMSHKKDDTDSQKIKSADSTNRRGSTLQISDTVDSFAAIEAALTAWGTVYKSGGGAGVAMAWKFVIRTGSSVQSPTDGNGCVDGVAVLIGLRAKMSLGVAVFDAFGFNCPYSLIKAECDSVISILLRTAGLAPAVRRLNVPLPLWVSPVAFSKSALNPLSAPIPHTPKSSSDKSMISIPPPSIAAKRLSTFSSLLHPCQLVTFPHTQLLTFLDNCFLFDFSVQSPHFRSASLAASLSQVRISCGFVPLMISSSSDVAICRETSILRGQNTSSSLPLSLSNIFVISVLPPSMRSVETDAPSGSLCLVSTCLLSGDHSLEIRLSISMWNSSVRASVSLCDADSEWLSEVASALRLLDERTARAFTFKTAIHSVINSSYSFIDKDAASQFLDETSGSCLLQLSRPANSDRLVFTLPHTSISAVSLVDSLSSELQARFPAYMSKNTFASKIDDNHIGVILLSQSGDAITVDAVVFPEQDSSEPSDPYIGNVPPNLAGLLCPDEGERSPIVLEALSPFLKDWLRSVLSACERTLSNAAFRCAHQIACLTPETIDSVSMLKVLSMAQCISIDITFADLLSVNEKTATSLFGSVSLFQSLSPEHIQRVEHAIADAISDHRAADAMLSFCSATSANGVYAMNIKQQPSSLLTRRNSTISTNYAILAIDTVGIDEPPSSAPSSFNTNQSGIADTSDLFTSSASAAGPEISSHQSYPSLENDLMFVRIGQLTSDGLVLDYLCEHSSGSSITKSNRLDSARKQDVSILQSLNARLSVRAISVYYLVAGTVSSCVLSILQSRRPLPDMLFQAVNTLMSSARYAPPAMRPSESSFTGHLVSDSGTDDVASASDGSDVQLVINNLTLNRVSFHFAFVLFAPSQSGVTWLCLVQLPGDASVVITPSTTLQDVAQSVIIPFWIVLRVSHVEAGSICVDSWILTDRDDREALAHSVKLHVEFALLHANQYLLMKRLLQTRRLPALLAQSRSSFSSAPLPEATRFLWGKPVSQWPSGSCGCRIIHHVVLEVHYRLDIGEALAQILSQSFLRPWKVENASDVFVIGCEPQSCVYAHVSKLEPREAPLQRSASPTLSTNNSIIIRFHGVSESSCVDLQPFCCAISQKLQALCVSNLLLIFQRNPSLRLSREDVDLLADPASPPMEAASMFTPVHGRPLHVMRSCLAALVSRVFFRLRFLDRRPVAASSSAGASALTASSASDAEDLFDFEDGVVFRFVRVSGDGGRSSDAWRGKAMSRGLGGEAMSLALCRLSCTFTQDYPSTSADDNGSCHITNIGTTASGRSVFDPEYFCQHKGGLLLQCKIWIYGSMASNVIVSKVSSLTSIAAMESSCVCSVAALTADSMHHMSPLDRANHIQRVHAASAHASTHLSLFKTVKFLFNHPLQFVTAGSAFSLICGVLALQYSMSCKILLERDDDAVEATAVDTSDTLSSTFKTGNEFNGEESQHSGDSSDTLQWRFVALLSKAGGTDCTEIIQYCTLEVTAVSVVACLYAADGSLSNTLGDVCSNIDRILEWTFLRIALLSTIANQTAARPIAQPATEFYTVAVAAVGPDGVACGEAAAQSEARADAAIILAADNEPPSDTASLQLDEMQVGAKNAIQLFLTHGTHQLLRLVDGSDMGAAYTFAPSLARAVIKDAGQRQLWLSNAPVRQLLASLLRVRRTIPKVESFEDAAVRHGQQVVGLHGLVPQFETGLP